MLPMVPREAWTYPVGGLGTAYKSLYIHNGIQKLVNKLLNYY